MTSGDPANSFASNGECGLKPEYAAIRNAGSMQFIRQQWRMWIETDSTHPPKQDHINSFASNGECGLKLIATGYRRSRSEEFIRQQWRMWIETDFSHGQQRKCKIIHSPAMANVD